MRYTTQDYDHGYTYARECDLLCGTVSIATFNADAGGRELAVKVCEMLNAATEASDDEPFIVRAA